MIYRHRQIIKLLIYATGPIYCKHCVNNRNCCMSMDIKFVM